MKWKEETSYARQDGRGEKPFGPTVEAFSGEHAKHDDEAGKDPDETDQRVNDCVYSQYHGDPPFGRFADLRARPILKIETWRSKI
jgi:hypothetical protein